MQVPRGPKEGWGLPSLGWVFGILESLLPEEKVAGGGSAAVLLRAAQLSTRCPLPLGTGLCKLGASSLPPRPPQLSTAMGPPTPAAAFLP